MVEERLVSREIHLKQRPEGMPTENNFQLVKVNIPDLKDGEFLVGNTNSDVSRSLYAWTHERN
jgi:NADPH-dependent curcumin reductase CurA